MKESQRKFFRWKKLIMWIIPKTHPLSSHFALDMVESKEDLTLQGLNIESSLMWRSKPTRLQTWLLRWNRISWMQQLFTRILKPFHRTSFETKLASSLEVIHVNHSHWQAVAKDEVTKTLDTFGSTYENTSKQLDLFGVSLKMLKDISHLDCKMSSKIWNYWVMKARSEYSQRVKLEQVTTEKEFLFWATPVARDSRDDGDIASAHNRDSPGLPVQVRIFPQKEEVKPIIGKMHDLNPDWVEQMMGIPTKWTDLDYWATESFPKQLQKHG